MRRLVRAKVMSGSFWHGSQPSGYTCLHFASDGSDKWFERAELARLLVETRADLEARTSTGNTAYLLATGTGVTDVMKVLMDSRADVNAVKHRGSGGYQNAMLSSSTSRAVLDRRGAARPKKYAASNRQWTSESESRQVRHLMRTASRTQDDEWQDNEWQEDEWQEDAWQEDERQVPDQWHGKDEWHVKDEWQEDRKRRRGDGPGRYE